MQPMKTYKATFSSDITLRAFYDRAHRAATAAGGNLWTSRNFDDPTTKATALLSLPEGSEPDEVLPLPVGSSWSPVEETPA